VTDLASCQYGIAYNPAVIRVIGDEGGAQGVTAGLINGTTSIPISMWQYYPTGTQGAVRILHYLPVLQPVSGSGYLAQVHFEVLAGTAGQSSFINLVDFPGAVPPFIRGLWDDSGTAITEVTWTDSLVSVSGAPSEFTTPVTGITREVDGDILPEVSITLDGMGLVVSDQNGYYQIMATATGGYTVTAHKDGFRDRTHTISIAGLGEAYAVTCNFQGNYGLIPNAPNMTYALMCINRWLYPPNLDTGLTMQTALAVINAWLYPVQ